ncbi:uncharacterized protein LOC115961332 [Quercus lobata]|uniref:uncharacterized protein LOC115961332 n=1 Tax=Quercus lobata TaxID=97700 RepID=UPI001245F462|nr:uncharacterized protein LOC115961332 [Quercus lobata]
MEQRRGHHGGMIEFKRLSPPVFEETTEPMEAEKWIIEMEKVFRVLECSEEFSKLAKFALTMVVDEENKARRFEDGLRFRIKQGIVPFELTTFRAVVSKALLVEMGLNEAQADRDNNQKKRPRPHAAKDCHWNTGACFSCGQRDHRIAECPQRKEVQTIPRPTIGQNQGASHKPKIQGRVYALTQHDANTSNAMVTGIIPISTTYAYALFDPGAIHSFISFNFA